jgi:transglutaminase-like putative cysteine protease
MPRTTVETVLEYEVLCPTHFCFNIEAAQRPGQTILSERLAVSSGVLPHRFVDAGTGNRFVRFDASPGLLMLNYQAEVELMGEPVPEDLPEVPLHEVPDDVLNYLQPSRYCESDHLQRVAHLQFGGIPPGIGRVRAISDWISSSVTYLPGSTSSSTSAQDVFVQRAGVCRDFAHLGITFCRALNIPARLAVGYVWFEEPPQDFHAVFEAWLGGRWVQFDPTGMAPVEQLVRIGTGRDARDVAFSTIFGMVNMTRKEVRVDEKLHALQQQIEAELVAEDA